jgi:hypothetical protein
MINGYRIRQLIALLFLGVVILCIFPPKSLFFQWFALQSEYISLFFLLLGLIMLAINRRRMLFVCLGCSAAISFYQHETHFMQKNADTPANKPATTVAKVMYYRSDEPRQLLRLICRQSPDIAVVYPDKTPVDSMFVRHIANRYSYHYKSPTGALVFAQQVPTAVDTLHNDLGQWTALRIRLAALPDQWIVVDSLDTR